MRRLVMMSLLCGLGACSEQVGPRREPTSTPAPMQEAHPAERSATPPTPVVTGRISVAPGIAVPPRATLFITGRSAAGGPPVLVKKVDMPALPYAFVLSTADVMMQGMPLPESFTLVARLDQDGDAISRSAGDLVAKLASPVRSGASDVELVFSEALQGP